MKNLYLKQVAQAVNGKLNSADDQLLISGISTDSRKAAKGELFIALKGERFNGHDYLKVAFAQGCTAAVVSEEVEGHGEWPLIKVDDTLRALQSLAAYYLSLFNIHKIAVTGSTGKTTTKELIYSVLSTQYKTVRNLGNLNNHIGLPLSIFSLEEEHEAAVFEMGMSGLGEIDLLASIVKPHISVITNIGLSHIEKLGSRENILKAKLEAVNYFSSDCTLVINTDDHMLNEEFKKPHDYQVIKVGSSDDSDFRISGIADKGESGVDFTLESCYGKEQFSLSTIGRHNACNASLAIAVGAILGVDAKKAGIGVSQCMPANMRLSIQESSDGIKIINDAYNASPDSMKAAIDTLENVKGERKIAILADMFEMGDFSQEHHYKLGEYASEKQLDMIISIGNHAKYIRDGALKNMDPKKILYYGSTEELKNDLDHLIQTGDVILVKGSRGMKMEEIVNYILKRC